MTTTMAANQLVNLMLSPPMQTPTKGRCAGQVTGASQHANGFVKGISYALRPGDLPFSAAASERALSLLCTAEAEQRKPPQQRGTGRPGQRDRHRCAAESGATGMPGLREALEIGLAEPPGIRRSPEVCGKQARYGDLATTTVAVAVTVFPARSVAWYVNVYVRSDPPVRSERSRIDVSSVPMSAPWMASAGHAP